VTAARDWYEARDAAGEVVFEFTAGAGTVLGVGILPKRGTALDGVAYGAAPAVRAALAAEDFGAACDALRAHGLSVERVPDLADVQVRISATGHPFTPGHKGGVGAHGEIGGKLSAASKALKEVSDSVAQAKQHAFLAGKAGDHASAAKHAADAIAATKKAEAGLAAVAKHGTKQQAAHAADLVKGARTAHTEAHAHADAKKVPAKAPEKPRVKQPEPKAESKPKAPTTPREHADRAGEAVKRAEEAMNRADAHKRATQYAVGDEAVEHARKAREAAQEAGKHAAEAQAMARGMGREQADIGLRKGGRDDVESVAKIISGDADRSAMAAESLAERRKGMKVDEVGEFFGSPQASVRALSEAFSASGHFKAEIRSVFNENNGLSVDFHLTDASGRKVGEITRTFKREDGRLVVKHDFFEISDERMQGTGAAKDVFRKSVALYEKTGVAEIKVEAGLSCGRYVWASYGFQARPQDVALFRTEFARTLRVTGRADDANRVEKYTSMQQIADHKLADGTPAGKNWLLSKDGGQRMPMWEGSLRLKKGDPGYERLMKKIA
jgi:hypothetical protein